MTYLAKLFDDLMAIADPRNKFEGGFILGTKVDEFSLNYIAPAGLARKKCYNLDGTGILYYLLACLLAIAGASPTVYFGVFPDFAPLGGPNLDCIRGGTFIVYARIIEFLVFVN